MVKVALTTGESSRPVLYAMAMRVVVADTAIGAV